MKTLIISSVHLEFGRVLDRLHVDNTDPTGSRDLQQNKLIFIGKLPSMVYKFPSLTPATKTGYRM
jgi:hypothetical protein